MFDYRLFFPTSTLDSDERAARRPLLGHDAKRIYRLAAQRRDERTGRERR